MRSGIPTQVYLQNGAGFGGIFRSGINLIRRFLFPAASKLVKSSVGKASIKAAKQAGTNLLADVVSGRSVKDSAKENLANVRESIGASISKIGKEGSKKRKKKSSPRGSLSKKKKQKAVFFSNR